MNQKRPYRSDEPTPEYLYEVSANRRTLVKGMEVSVLGGVNRPAGRYKFQYAEYDSRGTLLIYIYGPVRRSHQRQRMIRAEHIKTVHVRTRED